MSIEEQRRTMVLTRVAAGSVTMTEAAALLGLSERSVWRLKRRFLAAGPAGLVHGNRGRPSGRRLGDAERAWILELAGGRFAGVNDSHLVDLLADEGLVVSRATVQRILRGAGRPSPRHRRPPRHRSRRDRMAQTGLLLQLDGRRHDWLESRGPRLTLVGAIDDATGILNGASSATRRTSRATSRSSVTPWDARAPRPRRAGRPGPAPSPRQRSARPRSNRSDRGLGPEAAPASSLEPCRARHQALRSDPTGATVRIAEQLT